MLRMKVLTRLLLSPKSADSGLCHRMGGCILIDEFLLLKMASQQRLLSVVDLSLYANLTNHCLSYRPEVSTVLMFFLR